MCSVAMVLTSTHHISSVPFQEAIRELSGAPPISFVLSNGSGGLCWDTTRACCVETWLSLRLSAASSNPYELLGKKSI